MENNTLQFSQAAAQCLAVSSRRPGLLHRLRIQMESMFSLCLNPQGGFVVRKTLVSAVCLAFLCGSAMAQDAKTVIADAQKALGDVKSITYSGTGKDVSFQQCGANSTDQICKGTHNPMRPINNYVRVIDLTAPASLATG